MAEARAPRIEESRIKRRGRSLHASVEWPLCPIPKEAV